MSKKLIFSLAFVAAAATAFAAEDVDERHPATPDNWHCFPPTPDANPPAEKEVESQI